MKTAINILIFTVLLSCGRTADQPGDTTNQHDGIRVSDTLKKQTKLEKLKQGQDEKRIDSLRLEIARKDAFKIARPAFTIDNFSKQYELHFDDSSYAINIEILIGRLFQDKQKYFLLRRHSPWAVYLDLYKVKDDKAEKLIEREQGEMTYIRDTIFDVNGDGHKDFLLHWYPSSGCCRRDMYDVYLSQIDKGIFSKEYRFINPTFSAKEKVIRGVEYGHPGEVGLYKYKWNGVQVDTIEFIYPDASMNGQFIKTKKATYKPTRKNGIVLKAVPREYQSIESYEWFAEF